MAQVSQEHNITIILTSLENRQSWASSTPQRYGRSTDPGGVSPPVGVGPPTDESQNACKRTCTKATLASLCGQGQPYIASLLFATRHTQDSVTQQKNLKKKGGGEAGREGQTNTVTVEKNACVSARHASCQAGNSGVKKCMCVVCMHKKVCVRSARVLAQVAR